MHVGGVDLLLSMMIPYIHRSRSIRMLNMTTAPIVNDDHFQTPR